MKRVLMLATASFALVACGPGAKIDGKQGAADALFAASRPTKQKADTSASPADLTGGISWNCPEGGSADISGAGISIGGGGVSTSLTLKYNGCGLAKTDKIGVAVFNGSMTFSQSVTTGSTVGVSQAFKGKVLVQGAYDDFLDADVSQNIAVGDLGASGTGVSMTLKGTISTKDGTFTFDEMLSVISGSISGRIDTSRM
ncbi:MAG: hypothetical protein U0228_33370 [Myxococcaceae bacterium]